MRVRKHLKQIKPLLENIENCFKNSWVGRVFQNKLQNPKEIEHMKAEKCDVIADTINEVFFLKMTERKHILHV